MHRAKDRVYGQHHAETVGHLSCQAWHRRGTVVPGSRGTCHRQWEPTETRRSHRITNASASQPACPLGAGLASQHKRRLALERAAEKSLGEDAAELAAMITKAGN